MRFWYETSHHPRRRLPEKNRKLLNDSKLLWKTTFYMNQMRIVNVHQEKKRNRPPYACWFCFIIFGDLLVAGTCHIYLATFNTFNAVLVCASSAWLISRWHNDQPLPLLLHASNKCSSLHTCETYASTLVAQAISALLDVAFAEIIPHVRHRVCDFLPSWVVISQP